jgi:SAM-dependent methyltransferase
LPCPICSCKSSFETGFNDIRLFRCAACNHSFTDASSLERAEDYKPEYFERVHKNWFEHPDVELFERIRQITIHARGNATVLDIGCGNGNLLRYLREREPKLSLTGIDLSTPGHEKGITFLSGDVLTWPFDTQFDVVLNLQVIEHLPEPAQFIRRLCELCHPGGVIIINTINEQSLLYDIARIARRLGLPLAFERLFDRHHLNHYNTSSLRVLIQNNGLKMITHLRHSAPIDAMDIPPSNKVTEAILRSGLWGVFALGTLVGRSTYQTIVCRR